MKAIIDLAGDSLQAEIKSVSVNEDSFGNLSYTAELSLPKWDKTGKRIYGENIPYIVVISEDQFKTILKTLEREQNDRE